MAKKIVLVVPEMPSPQAADALFERRIDEHGPPRIGTLDNSTADAERLLRFPLEGVQTALPVASVMTLPRSGPWIGAESQCSKSCRAMRTARSPRWKIEGLRLVDGSRIGKP